jgi:hypothetical protein
MPQQGTQYTKPQTAAHIAHHDHFHGMKPWLQRTVIGIAVAVSVTGLTVMSGVVMENQKANARIEAKLDDVINDFDRFVDLRYQRDVDELENDVAVLQAALLEN